MTPSTSSSEGAAGALSAAQARARAEPRGGARPRYVWPCAASLALYVGAMAWSHAGGSSLPLLAVALSPIVSGSLVALATALQWLLWRTRSGGGAASARAMLRLHTWLGSLLPLLLLLHTPKLGRGALLALSLLFSANLAVGLVNPTVVRPRSKTLRTAWFVTHVALSLVTIPLLAAHVWTRVRYR